MAWFTLITPLSTLVAATDDDEAVAQAMMQPLNSMLNWGVANSDPEELKRIADMVHSPAAVTIATAATSPTLPSAALWPLLDDRRGAGAGRYSAAKQFRRQRYKHSLPHTLARHALSQRAGVQFKPQRCRSCPGSRGAPPLRAHRNSHTEFRYVCRN